MPASRRTARAVIALLGVHDPPVVSFDPLALDSFGVVGVSAGDRTWLTGRGRTVACTCWGVDPSRGAGLVRGQSLDGLDAMWAAPASTRARPSCSRRTAGEGVWRLRAHTLAEAEAGRPARGAVAVPRSGPARLPCLLPFSPAGPLVVAGAIGDGPGARRGLGGPGDRDEASSPGWAGVVSTLRPRPDELSSVSAVAARLRPDLDRRTHGRASGRLGSCSTCPSVVWSVDSCHDALDQLAALIVRGYGEPVGRARGRWPRATSRSSSRPPRGEPALLARRCDWKAIPAPDGRVRAACAVGGRSTCCCGASVSPTRRVLTIAPYSPAFESSGGCAAHCRISSRRCVDGQGRGERRGGGRRHPGRRDAGGRRVRAVRRPVGADRGAARGRVSPTSRWCRTTAASTSGGSAGC